MRIKAFLPKIEHYTRYSVLQRNTTAFLQLSFQHVCPLVGSTIAELYPLSNCQPPISFTVNYWPLENIPRGSNGAPIKQARSSKFAFHYLTLHVLLVHSYTIHFGDCALWIHQSLSTTSVGCRHRIVEPCSLLIELRTVIMNRPRSAIRYTNIQQSVQCDFSVSSSPIVETSGSAHQTTLLTVVQHDDTILSAPSTIISALNLAQTLTTVGATSTSTRSSDPHPGTDINSQHGNIGGIIFVVIFSVFTVIMMVLPWIGWRWLNKTKNNLQPSHPNWIKMREPRVVQGDTRARYAQF